MKLANADFNPPTKECAAEFQSDLWKCMFAEYLYKYLRVPLFCVQSQYDSWSIPNILNIHCIIGHSLKGCSSNEMKLI